MSTITPTGAEASQRGAEEPVRSFLLLAAGREIAGAGVAQQLEAGSAATLAVRAGAFFARPENKAATLVGALPFDRDADDHLFQPARILRGTEARAHLAEHPVTSQQRHPGWTVEGEPRAADYASAVGRALELIGRGDLAKIVLSRSLRVEASRALDTARLVARLAADPEVAVFDTPLPASGGASRRLVGATPELLVSRLGSEVASHPLAGSARRSAVAEQDRAAALALQNSDKDRREHALVVEQVLDALAPFCDLRRPGAPTLKATATMWHLGTRIAGTLRSRDTGAAELAAVLHPTPAVCGVPRLQAAHAIRDIEGYDRGFYAGAVGWCDAGGDGEWFVSLRCAEISGRHARLFAGAGIVAGSEPEREVAETSAKFLAMLDALGVAEPGVLDRARAA
jgi:isochorismate synthase